MTTHKKREKDEERKFKVGDTVKTKRSHDKATSVVGEVVKIHEDDDLLDIELPNSTQETAHFDDSRQATPEEKEQLGVEQDKAKAAKAKDKKASSA